MQVIFTVKYHTRWGERIFITGSCVELGDNDASNAKEMHYYANDAWTLEISLPDATHEITYRYLVEDENGVRKAEDCNFSHHVEFNRARTGLLAGTGYQSDRHPHCGAYCIYDDWFSEPFEKPFYSSAFTKNLFARPKQKETGSISSGKNMILRVRAPEVKPEQTLAITGNQPCLGNWDPNLALSLSDADFPLWEIQLNSEDITFPLEYKFIVTDSKTKQLCYWETGDNRRLILHCFLSESDTLFNYNTKVRSPFSILNSNSCFVIDNFQIRTPEHTWKTCGTVVPVFSLRSEQSFGIGDIGDIKRLIDWARLTNQHVIQVLPMNDTTRTHTWKDSYPYSAISIYALHPLYINIPMMGELKDEKKKKRYQKIQQRLNKKETVDYPSVEKYKTACYRDYFEQEKAFILENKDFHRFVDQNKEWLIPYAAFSYLRDKYHTADSTKWEDDALYNREKIEMFCQPENEAYQACNYLFFIQYTLHNQMDTIARYARQNRVILKGDLPIGINRESVEAWTEPAYFNMQAQAGAPPDFFSEKGQNWSFPTYNWEIMGGDGLVWWKKRFHNLQQYFDCFRIDHILGFFRIWEIPADQMEGLCGYFNPALPLQKDEIEQYEIQFDEQWLTPRIHSQYLPDFFGDLSIHDISRYLHFCDAEHLALNENCATQQKINALFKARKDRKSQLIKEGLMNMANEVLLIRDPYHPEGYHPRILAARSYRYRELSGDDRLAFEKIYHHFFFERHNDFWKQTAINRLQPLLKNTEMLVCGEDLGMIPATVHEVMAQFQIFSLELERMSKGWDFEFTDLTRLPYYSVCTTSTHDMNPIRAWWEENREKTQRYYNHHLHHTGTAPALCPAEITEQIITNHLKASSMITMIPIQDWFAMDENLGRPDDLRRPDNDFIRPDDDLGHPDMDAERINDPANPDQYWCYRIHVTLEALLQSTNFNEKIGKIITTNGR